MAPTAVVKSFIAVYLYFVFGALTILQANTFIIDDRSMGNLVTSLGTEWRFVADTVMGGVSTGEIVLDKYQGKQCLRLQGSVSTENNGGFVQMALSLADQGVFDASVYTGIEIEIAGNNESYNLHLRTADLWFPWQSYRASFKATPEWQSLRIPFSSFKAYKTSQDLRTDQLKRLGLLGIGREFQTSLCLALIKFYNE